MGIYPAVFVATEVSDATSAGWPFGLRSWTPQAAVAVVNLLIVVVFYFWTRRDKRREQQLEVDSFWLQKVIVEPHTKAVDELFAALEEHVQKAQAAARQMTGAGDASRGEAIGSYASTASRRLEKFARQILPLLRVVVDQATTDEAKPSAKVEKVIDAVDDAVTVAIARVFDEPDADIEAELEALRNGRFDLLHVLYLLHKQPFLRD